MSQKVKSTLYFASLVIALIAYANVNEANTVQNNELAENTIEKVSTYNALN